MTTRESQEVRTTLQRPEVHQRWFREFHTVDSRQFYEAAFDHIAAVLAARSKSTFLDAGCGDGAHSIRLARRGYPVVALDMSEYVLREARENVAANELDHMIRFESGSLLALPFGEGAYEFVLCWGVLMHIPEVETAIAELARVMSQNGVLIISEDNMWSVESTLVRSVSRAIPHSLLRRLRHKAPARLRVTAAGAEYWRQTESGPLICRESRISWLIERLAQHGFILRERIAGELFERHAAVPTKFLRRCVHRLNLAWFKYVRLPQPAMGNLLIFEKARA